MAESRTHAPQDFEGSLKESPSEVASFQGHRRSPVEHLQHVLHSNPALVPLIVLVLSLVVFGLILGERFFSPFSMTLILQQVAIVGIVGAAQSLVTGRREKQQSPRGDGRA